MLLSPQLLHDTNSIFYHQVEFYFFYHLKSVVTNLWWTVGGMNPQENLVASLNNLEILLVIEKLKKFIKKLVILLQFFSENRAASY